MSGAVELRCLACDSPLSPGDRFCEQCGARLADEQPESGGACRVCGTAGAIDRDGYCSVCGARERAAADRVELDLVVAAVASDRGRVHTRNEDAFSLEVLGGDRVAAVVCDGISSASASDEAARSATRAATVRLTSALEDPGADLQAATVDAVQAAYDAVAQVQWTSRADRGWPSCTLVSAVCRGGEIMIGSVGDSRAYWCDEGGVEQLTIDDSWAVEQVAEGHLTAPEAAADARSHAITNWIGLDAPARPPRLVPLRPERAGRLLLCSDGLWNYLTEPAELAERLDALPDEASAAAVARSLTDLALDRGGRDNITVVVVDVHPRPGEVR
jgi:serine/threonine protein phosphatase PrpC